MAAETNPDSTCLYKYVHGYEIGPRSLIERRRVPLFKHDDLEHLAERVPSGDKKKHNDHDDKQERDRQRQLASAPLDHTDDESR